MHEALEQEWRRLRILQVRCPVPQTCPLNSLGASDISVHAVLYVFVFCCCLPLLVAASRDASFNLIMGFDFN